DRPAPRPVSRTGVAAMDIPVHASADVLVWTDETGSAHWVRGCDGAPRTLDVRDVLGLTYPEVYYAGPNLVRALNLETGLSSDVAITATPDAFAANYVYAAWVGGDTLTVLDRRDGSRRRVRLPGAPVFGPDAAAGRLTIGDRLVAYALRPPGSDLEYGFVYDVVSGEGVTLPTEVFAGRDRLLWREQTSYLVAAIRPA
ncbi:MAG TPA: hypothetical protein VFC19_15170, partial [Candidatus Limnocylindrales bacterium]|nr:hypothetical protein [Candidatus Limnocylindrales bacterium]